MRWHSACVSAYDGDEADDSESSMAATCFDLVRFGRAVFGITIESPARAVMSPLLVVPCSLMTQSSEAETDALIGGKAGVADKLDAADAGAKKPVNWL